MSDNNANANTSSTDLFHRHVGEYMGLIQEMIKVYNLDVTGGDENFSEFRKVYQPQKVVEIYRTGEAIVNNVLRVHILRDGEQVLVEKPEAGFSYGQKALVARQMTFLRKVVHTTLTVDEQNEIFYPGIHSLLVRQNKAYKATNAVMKIVDEAVINHRLLTEDDEEHIAAAFVGREQQEQREKIAMARFAQLPQEAQNKINDLMVPVSEFRARVLALSQDIYAWSSSPEGQAEEAAKSQLWYDLERAYFWCRNCTTMMTKKVNGLIGYRFPKLVTDRNINEELQQLSGLTVPLSMLLKK